jgi:4-aminobutyrate aminotransferase
MTASTSLGVAPHLVTSLPGPKAAALIARDDQVLSPSYTRDYPLVIARGLGCTVEDVDGNLFLDFTAGIAVNSTGHSHPDVVAAICDQAQKFLHMSGTDFYYGPEVELAEKLAQISPGNAPKRVFFTNSGAESVEAALKLARFHTKRQQVISFFGAFHGRTYGALSLNGSKRVHHQGFGPLLAGVHRIAYNCPKSTLQELLDRVAPPSEVAAIFVEPVQGEGGYIVPDAGFLQMLRAVCDQHGILLVADEVQSGMGRTGRWFACEHFNVVPDMLCLAKGIASGMPLGALVARADVMDWPPGSHASTFGGNPVSCRAALASIRLIEHEYLANARARGEQLRAGLSRLCGKHPTILANVRGLGLMTAVDVKTEDTLDPARRNDLVQTAFYRGLLILGCGKAGIRFAPALCVTAAEIDRCVSLIDECCSALPPAPTGRANNAHLAEWEI